MTGLSRTDISWDGESLAGVFNCTDTRQIDTLILMLEHAKPTLPDMPYVYRWDRHGREGQPCNVTARGKFNSIRVEFADGYKMISSGNAIRKAKI